MPKSKQAVLLSLGLILAIAAAGQAQMRRPGTWSDMDFALTLTDEQLEKIQDIQLAFQEEILPLRMKWQKTQLSLDTMVAKGADESRLDAQIETLNEVDMELEKKYLGYRAQIRNVLTEKQRVMFDRSGSLGLGRNWDFALRPRWGMRSGLAGDFGRACDSGMGRGFRSGWGRGLGRGSFCLRWR